LARPKSQQQQTTAQRNSKWDRTIDENSREKVSPGGVELVAGAVLGGLLGGPFGTYLVGVFVSTRPSLTRLF
jgi:hypothetical protein